MKLYNAKPYEGENNLMLLNSNLIAEDFEIETRVYDEDYNLHPYIEKGAEELSFVYVRITEEYPLIDEFELTGNILLTDCMTLTKGHSLPRKDSTEFGKKVYTAAEKFSEYRERAMKERKAIYVCEPCEGVINFYMSSQVICNPHKFGLYLIENYATKTPIKDEVYSVYCPENSMAYDLLCFMIEQETQCLMRLLMSYGDAIVICGKHKVTDITEKMFTRLELCFEKGNTRDRFLNLEFSKPFINNPCYDYFAGSASYICKDENGDNVLYEFTTYSKKFYGIRVKVTKV